MLQTIDQLVEGPPAGDGPPARKASVCAGYGQRNPLQEYQKEGFAMFEDMIDRIHEETVQKLFTVQVAREEDVAQLEARRRQQPSQLVMSGGGAAALAAASGQRLPRRGRALRSARGRRSDATIHVPAVAARSTRSVTASERAPRKCRAARRGGEHEGGRAGSRAFGCAAIRLPAWLAGSRRAASATWRLIVSDVPARLAASFTTNRGQGGAGLDRSGARRARLGAGDPGQQRQRQRLYRTRRHRDRPRYSPGTWRAC